MKKCSCPKVLETYAVMEKNLLKVIDLLQYEKKNLIADCNIKISNIEKRFMSKVSEENLKLQSLSSEILQQKILNHELENRLKVADVNLKLAFVGSNNHLALRRGKIFCIDEERMHDIKMMVNKLYTKISLKLKQSEFRDDIDAYEIQNIIQSLRSEITTITSEGG
ncbi:hypothetical protein WA026_008031 [Henosepilachna vigintioctopunctata]|uniref:Uncharacterized protein n=1 Tax=Henosepilachna vigintioctopunctata TaxID=420089 RepID=A0AAW1TKN1_9CUCU